MADVALGVDALLDRIVDLVDAARAVPLSGGCVVNRRELLAELEQLRAALPPEVEWARVLLAERDELLTDARQHAAALVAAAEQERAALVADSEVLREAQDEAAAVVRAARTRAAEMQAEVEDYIARRLAAFEEVLHRTLDSVVRGREALTGAGPVPGAARPDEVSLVGGSR